ncbi:serine/threonine-protein kinase [Corynebacterium auris]|uniref:serine/threonine-protein kinase n=1 Tax=Corynebacterium auris TaxID=44750 RepID=UPI0025B29715|nr:serine/threonine-protein kinase [Corynebacterium auris]WJY66980.1 Serine/threonine-protein kinase PknA [Corynebacterium auris]
MHTDNREELQELVGPDYRLQWVIGHGGMSTVWLTDDPGHDREVAIKVLRPEFSSNEEFLTRFRNEASAAEGIDSPNVVATYDYREVDTGHGYAMCFIVMEYIRGESLADLIAREGQLDEDLALDVLEQASHGLAVIHRMGLVHRDIKPGNLMITQNGRVKITDFGIAKAAAAVPLTRTGMVVGTAQYVSPEQAQGLRVSSASDVYSLGVVGYEMLSGTRPFTGDSSVSVALAHVSNEPPALSTSISAPARELIGIALRKDAATRFRDGNEMQLAVAQVRRGQRPTQPGGGQTTLIAVEPSPTESTQMLASVAQPTTVRPAQPQERPPQGDLAQEQHTAVAQPEQKEKKGGFGIGVLIAVLVLLVIGGVAWALTAGPLGGPGAETTTPETSVVTQTQTISPSPEQQTQTATTTVPPRVTTNESAPGTVSFVEPPANEPSEPAPAPAPAPTNPSPAPTPPPTNGAPAPAPTPPGNQDGADETSTDNPLNPQNGGTP